MKKNHPETYAEQAKEMNDQIKVNHGPSAPTIYSFAFLVISMGFIFLAWLIRGWGWFFLWPGLSFLIVAIIYLFFGPKFLGKRQDGTIPLTVIVFILPFFLFTWSIWYLLRKIKPEDCYNEFAPGLYIGRRCKQEELPRNVGLIVDLTSEFPEYKEVVENHDYLYVPTLDAGAPSDSDVDRIVSAVENTSNGVYIHCAAGSGRSAAIAAIVLLAKGLVADINDAISTLHKVRPGVHLNKEQKELIHRFYDRFKL